MEKEKVMRKGWLLSVGICLLWVSLCVAQDTKGQVDDNLLLAMVLEKAFGGGGGFTVVSPKTFFVSHMAPFRDGIEQTKAKEKMKEYYKNEGYDIDPLVDLLLERNMRSVRLSLKSCPQNGYFIDYRESTPSTLRGMEEVGISGIKNIQRPGVKLEYRFLRMIRPSHRSCIFRDKG